MIVTETDGHPLFKRIDALRWRALQDDTLDLYSEFEEGMIDLDAELQHELKERYGDANLRKCVPEWHKLVGSTPELHCLPDDARDYVVEKVQRFVESQEKKWGL